MEFDRDLRARQHQGLIPHKEPQKDGLRPVLFVCRRVRTTKAAQPKTGPTYYKVSPAIFLLILFYCPQNCNIALSYYGVHSLDVFA